MQYDVKFVSKYNEITPVNPNIYFLVSISSCCFNTFQFTQQAFEFLPHVTASARVYRGC